MYLQSNSFRRYGGTGGQTSSRSLQQTAATARDNSVSIDNLIRWKSATQQRIERLEHLLSGTPSSSGKIVFS